MFEFI
jgi:hypothetical protein